ncbi:MAG: hypothetical protein H6559_21605 [Lewinellaceae bacterium]|nr:hypothetical protein [Lewinellaceae bacterium]
MGAGCSGLTAIKNLVHSGVENVTCFEKNYQVGGNWIFTAGESHSSVCETTHIISSKRMSEFLDFPMPEHYPDYPSHAQVLAYFQNYARHFGLEKHIRFNTPVVPERKKRRIKMAHHPGKRRGAPFRFSLRRQLPPPPCPAGRTFPARLTASTSMRTTTKPMRPSPASGYWLSAPAIRAATAPWRSAGWPPYYHQHAPPTTSSPNS